MNLSEQEKKFADEYVFSFFHAPAVSDADALGAAEYAGYEVPDDYSKADVLAKSLLNNKNIRQYIDSEIERFRVILSGEQRRNLWKYISEFKEGEPETEGCYGSIINH